MVEAPYVSSIKIVIEDTVANNNETESLLLWDTIKCQVRGATITYSSIKTRKRENKIKSLQQEIGNLYDSLHSNPDDGNCKRFEDETAELEQPISEKTKGCIIRCKIRWYEEGEKSSQYFLNLEKINFNSKTIKRLINGDGREITDQKHILKEEQAFYKKLYATVLDKYNQDIYEHFMSASVDMPVMQNKARNEIDHEITEKELLDTLQSCSNGKSPGIDGLLVGFYKLFWNDIKQHFLNTVNTAHEKRELSLTQRQGTLSLLPKKGKNTLQLKNWQSISLLNADYKLIAKCISRCIKSVLLDLKHSDQTGFISSRYIDENINAILNILDYTEAEDIPSILAAIDFEKAFDYLE